MVHHLSRQWTPPFPFRSLPSRGMNRLACFYAAFNPLQVTSNNYHPTFNFSFTRVSIMPHENTFHISFKKSFIASKKSLQMTQSQLVNHHFLFPQLHPECRAEMIINSSSQSFHISRNKCNPSSIVILYLTR